PELGKLMRRLEEGDTVIVCRLDRLARSTRGLLDLLYQIFERGATFRSIKDAWADTSTLHGRLLVTGPGGLAQFERGLIRERTDDGRIRAKARGVRFGRPHKLTSYQRREILDRLAAGEIQADLARTYNVGEATISRLAARGPFGESAAVAQ